MKERRNNLGEFINALKNEPVPTGPPQELVDATLARLAEAGGEPHTVTIQKRIKITERIKAMKSFTKIAAAAVIIIAVVLSISFWDQSIPSASAAQVLQDAIDAVSDIWSVHMKARMRTLPYDNFSLIGLDFDFVPIEMWKYTNEKGLLQWRVEKPGRVLLMDGQTTTMLIRPNSGVLTEQPWPLGCYDSWMGRLLNVDRLLDNELQNAKTVSDREVCLGHEEVEGRDKIILEIDVTTDVAEGDYLRNKFISESDHLKVYRFDAKTKLLESLHVYVHTKDGDVLIFEVTDIEYNIEIDDGVFSLDLPDNMIWFREPEILPDNEKYEQMTPKEMATAFFQACADEDWDEFLKFWSASAVDPGTKDYLGGLEIVSIGEPFKSGDYPGWFVPYEIKLASKLNLALRNDNPAKRYVIDGIFDNKLQLMEDIIWSEQPQELPNNDTYAQMSPDEAVQAFVKACVDQDWDEVRKFWPAQLVDEAKGFPDSVEVVSVGEPFRSGDYPGWFVPCKIAEIWKHNLAVRNDNPAKRYIVDGGI